MPTTRLPLRLSTAALQTAAALTLSLAVAAPASADLAENLKGVERKQAERRLDKRGYEKVESKGHSQLWWSEDDDTCMLVKVDGDSVGHARTVEHKRCKDAHQGSGGDKSHTTKLRDLEGMRASSLDHEMNSRGFKNTGGYKDDNTAYTTWYKKSTRECVSVATREGRVHKIESIVEGNCL